jgi:hypothetical protein
MLAILWSKALKWLGHWLVYLILTAITLWAAYVTIIKPHINPLATTTEKAKNIYHINIQLPAKRVFGLGGTIWGMDLGIVKYDFINIDSKIIKEITKDSEEGIIKKEVEKVKETVKKKRWYFLWLF